MRLLLALIMLMIVLGSGSRASEPHGAETKAHTAASQALSRPLATKPGIDMPTLVAPMTVDGELHYYVFLSIHLNLASDGQRTTVLEKIPYIQDAFLREVHRQSLALAGDPKTIDGHGLMERLTREATKVLGPGVITSLEFRNVARTGA